MTKLSPDQREVMVLRFIRGLTVGETARVEFRVQHQNGEWRTLEAVGTNLLDDPAMGGMVVTARDITDRKRTEAELNEAQERFRTAFDHAPIGMALTSLDGRFFRVNRALARMLGRPDDELKGISVVALTHPDDRTASTEAMRRAITDDHGSGYTLEKRYVHANGQPISVTPVMVPWYIVLAIIPMSMNGM